MGQAARKTIDDLAALGESSRFELIQGELVEKASPSEPHSSVQGYLLSWLVRRYDRPAPNRWPGGWWIRPEVHIAYEPGQVHCPDLSGWRRDRHSRVPTGWPIPARPDWVCEVVSPGHERRDRIDKLLVLERAGVPHYWLIDGDERLIEVYRHTAEGYLRVQAASEGQVVRLEPFDAVELRTDVVFADAGDEE